MTELNLPPLLWLVAFQMLLHALMWGLSGVLLRESRSAVAHWGLFMLLLGLGLTLAGARGEPRLWWLYNGANIITVLGFAIMRRGTEQFMRVPSSDKEQLAVLLPLLALLALVGPSEQWASLRTMLAYATQAFVMLRTVMAVRPALAQEFGRGAMLSIVVPASGIALILFLLALRQLLSWNAPMEMNLDTHANLGLMFLYLGGSALFSFGFMVMLTQRLVAALRQASVRDPLTGLFNRRYALPALARIAERAATRDEPFAILLADIDQFKRVNDTFGHSAGDTVLVSVANRLRSCLRPADLLARIGGEEFLIALPGVSLEQAHATAERLRLAICGRQISLSSGEQIEVTASIGLSAGTPAHDSLPDFDQLIFAPDNALLAAKAKGRNRVTIARSAA